MDILAFEKLLQTHHEWYQQVVSGNEDADESGKINLEDETLHNYKGNQVLLHDASFANTNISSADFDQSDLSHAYLYQCNIRQTTFRDSNFRKTSLNECELTDVTFTSCVLAHINFEGSRFRNVLFENCELDWGYFSEGEFENVSFKQCRMEGVILADLTLVKPVFDNNQLSERYKVQVSNVKVKDEKGERIINNFEQLLTQ